jgi:hypothetical protein
VLRLLWPPVRHSLTLVGGVRKPPFISTCKYARSRGVFHRTSYAALPLYLQGLERAHVVVIYFYVSVVGLRHKFDFPPTSHSYIYH